MVSGNEWDIDSAVTNSLSYMVCIYENFLYQGSHIINNINYLVVCFLYMYYENLDV